MNVTFFDRAPAYFPADHFDMRCLRLQGLEAGPSTQLWLGASVLAPNGHTTMDASPMEKHYLVLEGEVTVATEVEGVRQEVVLRRHDSCRIAPGERRQLSNRGDLPATVLLAMPLAPNPTPGAAESPRA